MGGRRRRNAGREVRRSSAYVPKSEPTKLLLADATPGRTPFSTANPSATPTFFDRTPLTTSSTPAARPSSSRIAPAPPRIDPNLSLDAFQSRYTSEDNSSFQDLLVVDNQQRRDKHAWAWEAEKRANAKAVRGRQARERLVDVTKRMIESSGDGTVRLLDGPAGKPGEKRLLVDEGVEVGGSERLMIKGRDEKERLLITDGRGVTELSIKGKGREVVDERAKQFVDWDKPTVEEDEANKPIPEDELQVQTSAWPFKVRAQSLACALHAELTCCRPQNRNSLMFPPDADRNNPSSLPPDAPTASSSASTSRSSNSQPILIGEPKGIRYHATRMAEIERGKRSGASDASSDISITPSRSRIGAAIAGTPCEPRSPSVASCFCPRADSSPSHPQTRPLQRRRPLAYRASPSSTLSPPTRRPLSPPKRCKS